MCYEEQFIVDAVLNRMITQFSENGCDVVFLYFMTVLAATFCSGCIRLIYSFGAGQQEDCYNSPAFTASVRRPAVLAVLLCPRISLSQEHQEEI